MKTKLITLVAMVFWAVCVQGQTVPVFDGVKLKTERASVNTPNSDMASAIDGDELIYNSTVKVEGKTKNKTQMMYDVFSSVIQPGGMLAKQGEHRTRMVTRLHEGPVCICQKTGEVYLTQSYDEETDIQHIVFKKENVRLGITLLKKQGDQWTETGNFPYNSKTASVAHPAVSQSGDTLIFVSDREGGFGGTDLYYSVRKNGQWGEPVNMGKEINTAGMEMFPNWSADGTLFFASDARNGQGGLDIYYTNFKNGKLSDILTFASPVNSSADDFGFIPGPAERYAYFSSNRGGGEGLDDIYVVQPEEYKLDLLVRSTYTDKPVADAKVLVKDEKGKVAQEGITGPDGRLPLKLDMNKRYALTVSKPGYYDKQQELNLTTSGEFAGKDQVVYIDPSHRLLGQVVNILGDEPIAGAAIAIARDGVKTDAATTDAQGYFKADVMPDHQYKVTADAPNYFGTDVEFTTEGMQPGEVFYYFQLYPLDAGTRIGLKNIYYDYDKYNIRPDATGDLDRLAEMLKKYPDVAIRLESHTDCRGTDEYNQKLSERRAKAALDYLAGKGVDRSRIESIGLGESQLVNQCADGIDCSEEQHQENRRTVFEITRSKVTKKEQSK